ncbi:MAG TPA: peptidase T [Edaphocola sp.]|nr:peptidase T [Edaphocola sp.]
MNQYNFSVAERLMRYVQIDTQSDPFSNSQPSTEKQKDLSRLLVTELQELGIKDVELDENGYVYATIPSNIDNKVPTVCFCAHVDTAPDCSGTNVKPILHPKWDGSDIVLPDDNSVVISKDNHPYLQSKIGEDIITASGLTLLGADDKAGVAIIMDLAQYLMQHPEHKHGEIRLLFTPDEEIGRGVDAINMDKVNAAFGYTLDGGERGHLEGESFSADSVTIRIHGISAHPGYAKGKLVNAMKIAGAFLAALPKDSWSPETTEGKEGFVHPTNINGGAELTTINFIIRDHETAKLKGYEERLEQILKEVVAQYPGAKYDFVVAEQYRNMREILDKRPEVMAVAEQAYEMAGVPAQRISIRGGTDGSRLSFMGLPCPNIFTGEMAIHSKQEYVSVQDMQKAVEICANIATIVATSK